ncbi:LptF/LptG family permease [Maritimibacter sp. 55A14]|uniref:LptF/LptG family permease n=1 Tax=Maritimibacter sp. 55A14 TaxID=2174844 RepID=UPI001304E721|nr:LptF/LptG family permease [Maritimibacter sp. 55A14]
MIVELDRYLLRNNLGLFAALTGLALAILLLERLIRITDLISTSDHAVVSAVRMIANLVPHYLEMALPGALLIATIITIGRLSRSGEIVGMMSSGVSLYRIVRPYMAMAVLLALVSILVTGYLQPVSRYNYREIVHELKQDAVVAAFQERKFVQFDDWVVWTDAVDREGRKMGETFIVETGPDGSRRFLTGSSGALLEDEEGAWAITLADGMAGRIAGRVESGQGDRLTIDRVSWRLPHSAPGFRSRGADQRELTLTELIAGDFAAGGRDIDPVVAMSDLHDRISRAALLVVLPLVGVILGLNLGRKMRSGGVAIGILLLLVVQKLLEYGLLMAERGAVPPWAGLWPVVLTVAVGSVFFFHRLAEGRPLLSVRRPVPAQPVAGAGAARS